MARTAGPAERSPRSAVARSGYSSGHSTSSTLRGVNPAALTNASRAPSADRANGPGARAVRAAGAGARRRGTARLRCVRAVPGGHHDRCTRPRHAARLGQRGDGVGGKLKRVEPRNDVERPVRVRQRLHLADLKLAARNPTARDCHERVRGVEPETQAPRPDASAQNNPAPQPMSSTGVPGPTPTVRRTASYRGRETDSCTSAQSLARSLHSGPWTAADPRAGTVVATTLRLLRGREDVLACEVMAVVLLRVRLDLPDELVVRLTGDLRAARRARRLSSPRSLHNRAGPASFSLLRPACGGSVRPRGPRGFAIPCHGWLPSGMAESGHRA